MTLCSLPLAAGYGDQAAPRPWWVTLHAKTGIRRETGLHNRRHTHAVLLMQNQVPIKVVAHRHGHADPSMTLKVYQHVTEQAAQLAIQALDRALSSASSDAAEAAKIRSVGSEFVDSAPAKAGEQSEECTVTG